MPSECEARAVATVHGEATATHTQVTPGMWRATRLLPHSASLRIRTMMRYVTRLSKSELTGVHMRPLEVYARLKLYAQCAMNDLSLLTVIGLESCSKVDRTR